MKSSLVKNMNLTKAFLVVALALFALPAIGLAKDANPGDITYERDNARILNSEPSKMEGDAVVKGNSDCDACEKNTVGGVHNGGAKIEPAGSKSSTDTKTNDVSK